MTDQSPKYTQKTLLGFGECIASQESQGGNMHSTSQDGETLQSGRAQHPASPFPARVKVKVKRMKGTSGPSSTGLSPSAGPRLSLANRLAARLDVDGSPEYTLTWKRSAIECHETNRGTMSSTTFRLRARGRRTSDSGCSGWPTPQIHTGPNMSTNRGDGHRKRNTPQSVLGILAGWRTPTASEKVRSEEFGEGREPGPMELTGWGTPTVMDYSRGAKPPRPQDTGIPLTQQVGGLTGWATPTAGNHRSPKSNQHGKNSRPLQEQAGLTGWATPVASDSSRGGEITPGMTGTSLQQLSKSTSSTAETAKPVASPTLNPAFSRWLMGFPESWDLLSPGWDKWEFVQQELIALAACEDTATQ